MIKLITITIAATILMFPAMNAIAGVGVGMGAAGIAMGAAAMDQADDNQDTIQKNKAGAYCVPPIKYALKNKCKLRPTKDIGIFNCNAGKGYYTSTDILTTDCHGKIMAVGHNSNKIVHIVFILFGILALLLIILLFWRLLIFRKLINE